MPRPKGSKNKKAIADIETEDLLSSDVDVIVEETKEEVKAVVIPVKKEKKFVGFHPITGEEVYN